MESQNCEIIVSCPGKILLVGGYAVISNEFPGITLGIDQKFYATLSRFPNSMKSSENESCKITINSPQIGKKWNYIYNFESFKIEGIENESSNAFIEHSLEVFFALKESSKFDYCITLYQDSAFFHNSIGSKSFEIPGIKIFNEFANFENLEKAGLGGSSCVVVCVLGALLHSEKFFDCELKKKEFYLLALVANSRAQHKIGSGFDIATCIFGSQVFSRVDSSIIERLSEVLQNQKGIVFREKLEEEVKLIGDISTLSLPTSTRAFLVQQNGNYDTVNSVKGVLSHFENTVFLESSKVVSNEFLAAITQSTAESRSKLRTLSKYYNDVLHVLSVRTKTPILPNPIHKLFNKVIFPMEEVLFFVVPGAGGSDDFVILGLEGIEEDELAAFIEEELNHEVNVRKIGLEESGFTILKGN